MDNIDIKHIKQFDALLIGQISHLLGQLTSRVIDFNEASLRTIIESEASHLFVMYEGERIIGMATLCTYLAPTGRKGWIEDVVIDIDSRSRGLGHRLMQHAITFARRYAPCSLMLTSNPLRIEANALYRSEGFEPRCTNVYKMEL